MLLSSLVPDGTASVLFGHLGEVPDANRRRVVELEQQGDWAGLAAFAEGNIARDPFSGEWRLVAGYARLRQGEAAAATVHFSELLRLAPDDPSGYRFLAEAQRAAGQPERAVTTLERGLRVVADDPVSYRLLGDAYSDLKRYTAAAAAYRRALELDPAQAEAWSGFGMAAYRLGRREELRQALQALERMQSPRAAELRRLLAE